MTIDSPTYMLMHRIRTICDSSLRCYKLIRRLVRPGEGWGRKVMALMAEKERHSPRMRPNHRRILEAVLFLISEATRQGKYVTEYDIDKSIFIADVEHLNKYGRPITYDNFAAMKDGPVPSATRDILQPGYKGRPHYIEEWPPWDRVPSPADGNLAHKFINAKREPNLRALSKTDTQCLREALTLVKSKGFRGTRQYTHDHPAYVDAWPKTATGGRYWMDYEKLFKDADPETVEDLIFSSKNM
jgi:hypothetical protein